MTGATPADVAAKSRHHSLARYLRKLALSSDKPCDTNERRNDQTRKKNHPITSKPALSKDKIPQILFAKVAAAVATAASLQAAKARELQQQQEAMGKQHRNKSRENKMPRSSNIGDSTREGGGGNDAGQAAAANTDEGRGVREAVLVKGKQQLAADLAARGFEGLGSQGAVRGKGVRGFRVLAVLTQVRFRGYYVMGGPKCQGLV